MGKVRKVGFSDLPAKNGKGRGAESGCFEGGRYQLLSNFGLQGSVIFSSQEDYDRFEAYLYLLNAVESPRASNFFLNGREKSVFETARGENLIAIGAYSFTPKRFYILATPLLPNGIARFMQKLQTAYTMYFNLKYQRDGRIFHSSYQRVEAESEKHLKYLCAAVHLHPAVIFDAEWEEASDIDLRAHASKATQYRYSSIGEYTQKKNVITMPKYFPKFISTYDSDRLLSMWKKCRSL